MEVLFFLLECVQIVYTYVCGLCKESPNTALNPRSLYDSHSYCPDDGRKDAARSHVY